MSRFFKASLNQSASESQSASIGREFGIASSNAALF